MQLTQKPLFFFNMYIRNTPGALISAISHSFVSAGALDENSNTTRVSPEISDPALDSSIPTLVLLASVTSPLMFLSLIPVMSKIALVKIKRATHPVPNKQYGSSDLSNFCEGSQWALARGDLVSLCCSFMTLSSVWINSNVTVTMNTKRN